MFGGNSVDKAFQQSLEHMQKRKIMFFSLRKIANATGARHWHVVYEAIFVRRGGGTVWINAQQMTFAAGDLIWIRPGDVHATRADLPDGYACDVLQFFPDVIGGIERIASGVERASEEMHAIFDAFARETQRDDEGQQLTMMGLVHLLGGWMLRRQDTETKAAPSGFICAVQTYLETAQSLRLQNTAAQFGYAPEHLSRRFHAETGISYRNWCEMIRLQRASMLLREEAARITDIAGRLGYSDESSFIRAFRRTYGITPYAYRKSQLPVEAEKHRLK